MAVNVGKISFCDPPKGSKSKAWHDFGFKDGIMFIATCSIYFIGVSYKIRIISYTSKQDVKIFLGSESTAENRKMVSNFPRKVGDSRARN